DEAIVIYFKAPFSFTGEDIVEFQVHGGFSVSEILLEELISLGPAAKQLTNGYYNYSNNGASFGNPDLKPEESTNYELGVDFRIF
ncbi:TonB-dependent receptor, partial [Campylobacter coli]|uniref:TonB-dependent receptor domain-containing protein n=1 Tax=Campylobacter coli TaxID=195 RepID=UPI002E3532F1